MGFICLWIQFDESEYHEVDTVAVLFFKRRKK